MYKFLAFIFLLSTFFPSSVNAVSDHVVINEFLPNPTSGDDWVELYNPTNNDINISGWVLRDTAASVMKTIPASTIILSKKFRLEYVGTRLNIDSDTIYLRTSDSSNENVDSKSYSTNPGTGVSVGRSPDGEDNWVMFNIPTPGSSNNPESPIPTQTAFPTDTPTSIPTPTPTEEPAHTPEPTAEPTENPATTPTAEPSPTIIPTETPTENPTPIVTISPTPTSYHKIIENRIICRFSYNRFKRFPNAKYIIHLLKMIFGPQSFCSS